MSKDDPIKDPRFLAAVDLIGRTGAKGFQIRYDDDPEPTVWCADVLLRSGQREAAGGMTPTDAATRLAEVLIDGGHCAHCGKMSAMSDEWRFALPVGEYVCWFVFDPETERYRRSCEGETSGRAFGMGPDGEPIGRNDPCPCGSGLKWKRCHGGPNPPAPGVAPTRPDQASNDER